MKKYYRKKSPKATIINLVGLFFILFFIVVYFNGGIEQISVGWWTVLTVLFTLTVYGGVQATKPTLTIHKDGVDEYAAISGCGFIGWDNIKNVEIRKGVNTIYLCIDLIDEDTVLNSVNFIKRMFMKNNKKRLGTICVIPSVLLHEELDDIVEEIKKYRDE